jgi:hypothetical protein
MNKVKLLLIGLALATPTMIRAANNIGVEGSPHDLSQDVWNTRKGVCSPCHGAHNTDPQQLIPLWVHATSAATFIPYQSPTMQAAVGQPNGSSLACLSCHDGTVAINQGISGVTGTAEYIDVSAQIGPDLHTTHPISFTYDAALAAADGGLENPDTYKIGDPKSTLTVNIAPVPATWAGTSLTGQTLNKALLGNNHMMQCSSCHDVHKLVGSAPSSGIMTKISGTDAGSPTRGSTLCRTCHIK